MFQLTQTHPRYPKYKPTNIDWIGDVPDGWDTRRLKYIAKLIMGQSPDGESVNDEGIGVPFFQGKSEFGTLSPSVRKWCSEPTKIAKENDILISVRAPVGDLNIANSECCIGRGLAAVRNNEYKFLYYGLFSQHSQLNSFNTGSTFEAIGGDILANALIVAPPIEVQREITAYLDEKTTLIDEAIAKKQRQIELLSERRTALINNAITKGLDPNSEMKDSGIEWIGMIPKEWEVTKLKYLGEAITGLTYKPEDLSEDGMLVIRSSNIQNGKLAFEDNAYVNMDVPEKLIIKEGDIVICSRNGSRALIGKNVRISAECIGTTFGAFMTVFRTKNSKFVSYVLNSNLFASQIETFLTSTINQLTLNNLNNLTIAIPLDLKEQEDIVAYLDAETAHIDEMKEKIQHSISLLQEYRTSLISHVVSGKIKVS